MPGNLRRIVFYRESTELLGGLGVMEGVIVEPIGFYLGISLWLAIDSSRYAHTKEFGEV